MLFISHDLSVTRYISDAIAVMQAGRIVERGCPENVLKNPQHPYTQILVAASPRHDDVSSPASEGSANHVG
jgi:peptide/nickel transport system ATP-binding protein